VSDEIYDFVVIGSGAGGGPVASNLALAGYTVLVLEAGGDCDTDFYKVPCFHTLASEDPDMSWDFFVRHYDNQAMQQRDSKFVAPEDGILYPRAGTLGGCTAHNAMITVYPQNSDWEALAKLTGDPSWSAEKMRTYFERLEHCDYIRGFERFKQAALGFLTGKGSNPGKHGFSGWLHTQTARPDIILKDEELIKLVTLAALSTLANHLDCLPVDLETFLDSNDWRAVNSKGREGVGMVPLATNKGSRNGTRERLLDTVKSSKGNLSIRTGALASRIVFEGTRAVGVEYLSGSKLYRASRHSDGAATPVKAIVYARREVILSGGAFNSPQLLMLSGIGDANELRGFGISPVVHLPAVGKNMQDRYEVGIISEMARPFSILKGLTWAPPTSESAADSGFLEWQQGRGIYTTNGACIAITKRSVPTKVDPDLFVFGLPSYFKGYFPGYSGALKHYSDMFTWAILKAHTNNTAGEVKLRSADPRDTPSIHFHYFAEGNDTSGADLNAVVQGVKFAREMNQEIRKTVGITEVWPGPNISSDAEIADFIQREAWGHHASCTNPIGVSGDPKAVLDSRFRVQGTTGLRVVDASVFPRIPGYFIVSAVYMIAEKASDVILEDTRAVERAGGKA
jgi:choline dehydrogenase